VTFHGPKTEKKLKTKVFPEVPEIIQSKLQKSTTILGDKCQKYLNSREIIVVGERGLDFLWKCIFQGTEVTALFLWFH
jgi:hypothetical protein